MGAPGLHAESGELRKDRVASVTREAMERLLEAAFEAGVITDALVAQSLAEARRFWTVREGIEMDAALPGLINLDVSLATGRLDDFARSCRAALLARFPAAHVSFYGHVADSNLHVAVSVPGGGEEAAHEVDRIAYGVVQDFGGSISAEHGIGTLKRDWLHCSRSEAELAARQMPGGGQMIAFEVAGGKSGAFRCLNALRLIILSNNLGDAKSIITHPATTTHFKLTPAQRDELGISDGMIRLSVGLEAAEDLADDLTNAVKAAKG